MPHSNLVSMGLLSEVRLLVYPAFFEFIKTSDLAALALCSRAGIAALAELAFRRESHFMVRSDVPCPLITWKAFVLGTGMSVLARGCDEPVLNHYKLVLLDWYIHKRDNLSPAFVSHCHILCPESSAVTTCHSHATVPKHSIMFIHWVDDEAWQLLLRQSASPPAFYTYVMNSYERRPDWQKGILLQREYEFNVHAAWFLYSRFRVMMRF